jgi:hypothetical protein
MPAGQKNEQAEPRRAQESPHAVGEAVDEFFILVVAIHVLGAGDQGASLKALSLSSGIVTAKIGRVEEEERIREKQSLSVRLRLHGFLTSIFSTPCIRLLNGLDKRTFSTLFSEAVTGFQAHKHA